MLGLAATITTSVGNGVEAWAVRELSMIPLRLDPRDAQDIAELKAAYCRYVDTISCHPRLFAPNATFDGFAFDTCNVQGPDPWLARPGRDGPTSRERRSRAGGGTLTHDVRRSATPTTHAPPRRHS